jgi:hypothetical protein
MEESHN